MKKDLDRRRFVKIAGTSMGVGALYTVWPSLGRSAEAAELARRLGAKTGERPTPFTFAQLSDAHVGFDGPIGTRAAGPRPVHGGPHPRHGEAGRARRAHEPVP